jgi:large subunit ribosomal protein L9
MKVILLEDVRGVGEAGSVESVSDGYARNYLLPRKLAIPATGGSLKNLDHHRAAIRRRQAREAGNAQGMAERLAQITLQLKAKAGEAGRIYGAITHAEVAEALASQHELKVDRRAISFPHPIKTLGQHEASVHLHKDLNATLRIEVGADDDAQG